MMSVKRNNLLGLLVLFAFVFQSFKPKEPIGPLNFNANWKFKLLQDKHDTNEEYAAANYNDANWRPVSLPHTAHIEPLVVNNQWQGICWYRKTFELPAQSANKKILIKLEAAMNYSKIWINGTLVKTHQGGYLPIVIDATPYLKTGQKNTIAVRLDNNDNKVTGPKPLKILDFNMYGGLYRNAYLIIKDKVHISNPVLANKVAGGGVFITYPKVSSSASVVNIKTNVINEDKISAKVEVVNAVYYKGKLIKKQQSVVNTIEASGNTDFENSISLKDAHLWSPRHPNLYTLKTTVIQDGNITDKETHTFGIRSLEFRNNDLYINGEKTLLRGVNRHQEYPFIGDALSDNAQYRDAKKIKDAGFDYVRLSHYPQSPAFLTACDQLGLLVADAILGWQYYADNDDFRNYCYTSAQQLIRRDRNHPCVLTWEVSLNETNMPIFFMERLNKIVHQEYPGKEAFSSGWMDDVYDIYFQSRQHRLIHKNKLKDKPYVVSEYGDWEYYANNGGLNQDKLPKDIRLEHSSRQLRGYGESRMLQQLHNVVEAHNDNFNTPAFADGYWVMYDYNRGYYDNLEASGLMDIFRLPKFAYYFFQSQRDPQEQKVLKIASYWDKNSPLDVNVLSNCDEVKLYLNNTLISTQKPDKNKNTNNLKHPPFTFKMPRFEPGTLKAVDYLNGKEISEQEVKTPEKPTRLKVWLDESGKKPQSGKNDVLFLYVSAVDDNGTIDPDFSDEVNLKFSGDVSLMNVGKVKAEAGIATALIKIGDKNSPVHVTASANNLKDGRLKFKVSK